MVIEMIGEEFRTPNSIYFRKRNQDYGWKIVHETKEELVWKKKN